MPQYLLLENDANNGQGLLFKGCSFTVVPTNSNGGCAIHSAFGNTRDEWGRLFLPDCRPFLRTQLGPTADECERRVDNSALFSYWVENDFWKDTITLLIKKRRRCDNLDSYLDELDQERRELWLAIQKDANVFTTLCNLVLEEDKQNNASQIARKHILETFNLLCKNELRTSFFEPLLQSLGIFEEFCTDKFHPASHYGLHSRLDVILGGIDNDHHLKQALLECKGVDHLEVIITEMLTIATNTADFPEGMRLVIQTMYECANAVTQQHLRRRNHARQGFNIAYAIYLDVMCKNEYWLSTMEIQILCRCCKQSIVICRRDPVTQRLHYLAQQLNGNNEPVFVALIVEERHLNAGLATRSHFERLDHMNLIMVRFGHVITRYVIYTHTSILCLYERIIHNKWL